MLVSELGEFGLIRRIAGLLHSNKDESVVIGIGDDVAVLRTGGPDYLLATCDTQVENIHFLRSRTNPLQLGRKSIAINVSDIAAMGGIPTWCLVSLSLPGSLEVGFVESLYEGIRDEAVRWGVSVVGGNLSGSGSDIKIDLCMLGKVSPGRMVLRSGAKEGDAILVTGHMGDSRGGLEMLQDLSLAVPDEIGAKLLERHLTPTPRLHEGQALAASGMVNSMADVSDGLLSDIGHICEASGVGAEIYLAEVPVSQSCRQLAAFLNQDVNRWSLSGGEDYELVFTAPAERATELVSLVQSVEGTACTVVGRVVPLSSGVCVLLSDGTRLNRDDVSGGWDHFGPG